MPQMVQVPFGHTTVSRIAPLRGPQYYKSYSMSRPLSTHWRRATCEEYECDPFIYGFVTTVDLTTSLGLRQFRFLKNDRKRSCHVQRTGMYEVKFIYGPGNICMSYMDHKLPLERLPFYYVSDGDWRGNPRGTERYLHRRPDDWVDDFANHQMQIDETLKRG